MFKMSPFHQGELEIQRMTGEQDNANNLAGLIQKTVMPAALEFITHQSIIWIGVKDEHNQHWAFPIFGSPGFIQPNQGQIMDIDLSDQYQIPSQWLNYLNKGNSIGCLVIELSTRRRLRINGIITKIIKNKLQIEVHQSFPNCPKYIRRRTIKDVLDFTQFVLTATGKELNENIITIINHSDTAFVTSSGPNGIDISHRGGECGFIKTAGDNKIIVPDYAGNSMYSTLGNFKINSFGSLIIVDFDKGCYLQVHGKINIFINKDNPDLNTGGSLRYWELIIDEWQLYTIDKRINWQSLDFSPFNP